MYIINVLWIVFFAGCFYWGYKFANTDKAPNIFWILFSVPAILNSIFTTYILLINAREYHLSGIGNGGVGANFVVFSLFSVGLFPLIYGWVYWFSGKMCKYYIDRQKPAADSFGSHS